MTGQAGGPSGERSIGIGTNTGIANTGDNPRFIHLGAGDLKSPEEVPAPAGLWNVPRRPSRVFVGRDKVMDQVAQTLVSGAHGVIGQSVAGLGGVGKTEVALHHAYACRDRYTGVWWIGADSRANLTAGLAALAHRLAPATTVLPDYQAEAWASAWLCHHRGWLLILDNVEEPGYIEPLLGNVDGGRVLVTTRRNLEWADHGLTPIRLETLTPAEAVQVLYERTGQDDHAAAAGIAEYLGCLPLALEQAAAFINHHHISMAAYRDRLNDQPGGLLASGAPGRDAQRVVTRVWEITFEALNSTNPAAVEVLRVLAWLAPDDVPRDLIIALTDDDQTAADLALGLLASYSMITLDGRTVSTHRLVQAVLRLTPSGEQTVTIPSDQAIQLLKGAIPGNPDNDPAGWPRWRDLLPHVAILGDHLPHSTDTTLGHLLNQAALFESGQGLYRQAELHSIHALAIAEAALGPAHPIVAAALGNLAASYRDLGRSGEAVPLNQRALAIVEAALGPDHPDVAVRLSNLAVTYSDLGRPGEAVPLDQRALAIAEAALGPDHPTVATCLGNLAASYSALGRPGEAVPLGRRALVITEAALGPDHPDIAARLGSLAGSYRDLGRPGEAVPLNQRALVITEAALGPNHPDIAVPLSNLAGSYRDLGRPGEAVPLDQRALMISEAALGPNHPTVASCLGNLAASYSALGRPGEALPLNQRALAITEAAFGPDHPDVAIRLGNLAGSYSALDRHGQALPLNQRALAITEAAFGPSHPTVAIHLGNLGASYSAQGQFGEASSVFLRALAITEAAHGPDHPDVAVRLGNLAAGYLNMGQIGKAMTICRRAVRIADQAMPDGHPTAVALHAFLKLLRRETEVRGQSG